MIFVVCVHPSSSSSTPHLARSHHSFDLYRMYRDFWLPYVDEQSPLQLIAGATTFFIDDRSKWLMIVVLQFLSEMYFVLVTTLMDKKHTLVRIGRKFFKADAANARVGKRQ